MINYKTEFIKLRYSGFICYSCMPVILESLACYLLLFKVLLNFSLVSYQTKNRYIRKFVPPTIYSFEKKSQVLLWWQKIFSATNHPTATPDTPRHPMSLNYFIV